MPFKQPPTGLVGASPHALLADGNAGQRLAASTLMILMAQLVMAGIVVYLFEIEGQAFLRLFLLAFVGFTINQFLPYAWRLPFFVFLSLVGIVLVFGIGDGAWLIGCGLALIGVCHVPVPISLRISSLLLIGVVLAASRAGMLTSPWSAAVWPILGSMFMFRLMLYVRALKTEPRPGRFWAALGYFFMFPNLVFPLFPVIDYQTFRRTYQGGDEAGTYQQGLLWIARGLVHLVLYRLMYHEVLRDPADVLNLGDLVQFMLGTILLYLRVSGTFHLIVGMLHLFGFQLPETNRLYFLAHSFTNLWRRINIYWKDFMMSLVFYPAYFRVKQLGPAVSVGIATVAVFVTTWVLHSYQWFWLRGGFPLTLQDVLFWGLLGSLVVIGAIREIRRGPQGRTKVRGWSLRAGLGTCVTFSIFCVLWSLWSAESISQWLWMLGAAAEVNLGGAVLLGTVLASLVLLGGQNWDAPLSRGPAWLRTAQRPSMKATVSLGALILLGQPALQGIAPERLAASLSALRTTGLNVRDAALQHRGYYEQLDVRRQLPAQTAGGIGSSRDDWKDLSTTGVLRIRGDFLERDLLPSRSVMWNGLSFSTNRWGMRDQDYALEKPAGTFRIALLGPSHAMGNGVADGDTFESLVERRLNREFSLGGYERFEVLNFAVDGYCLTQQVAMLEDRVLRFSPDVIIATIYKENRLMTESFVAKVVWRNIEVPYAEVKEMLASAGLQDLDRGAIPVPFESWRSAARLLGLNPRMPHGESQARIHGIAVDLSAWSMARFAGISRAAGARPVVLALDAVLEQETQELPDGPAIQQAELPVINLLGVFPADKRPALRVASWDDHPNAAGHRVIADRLYSEVTDLIQREFGNQ